MIDETGDNEAQVRNKRSLDVCVCVCGDLEGQRQTAATWNIECNIRLEEKDRDDNCWWERRP